MTWTKFFDGIYLINRPDRTDRFMTAAEELADYEIPFETIPAHTSPPLPDGQTALILTMKELFTASLAQGCRKILVFEDDAEFIENPNNYMPAVIRQLDGKHWDVLSLGPNTHVPFEKFEDTNLLKMHRCRALHAMAYNVGCMHTISKMNIMPGNHLDVIIEERIQPQHHSYCTYPLLCTQRNGHSDISNGYADQSYIVERFNKNVQHLLTSHD